MFSFVPLLPFAPADFQQPNGLSQKRPQITLTWNPEVVQTVMPQLLVTEQVQKGKKTILSDIIVYI